MNIAALKISTHPMWRLLLICGGLALIQFCRIGLRAFVFLFFERTLITDTLFSIVFMLVASGIIMVVAYCRRKPLPFFPQHFTFKYVLITVVVGLLFSTGVFFVIGDTEAVLYACYGALVTPLFEETLFRGSVWELLAFKKERTTYLVSTALFGLWHLGYFDTVVWRTSLLFPEAHIPEIMIGKVFVGIAVGLLAGALRYRNGNVYSSFLMHCFINTVGK